MSFLDGFQNEELWDGLDDVYGEWETIEVSEETESEISSSDFLASVVPGVIGDTSSIESVDKLSIPSPDKSLKRGSASKTNEVTNLTVPIAPNGRIRKRQRTSGEPSCLRRLCQWPVLISNALNAGDDAALAKHVHEVCMSQCKVNFDWLDEEQKTQIGSMVVESYYTDLLQAVPDCISEIVAIRIRAFQELEFEQVLNGNLILDTRSSKKTEQSVFSMQALSILKQRMTNNEPVASNSSNSHSNSNRISHIKAEMETKSGSDKTGRDGDTKLIDLASDYSPGSAKLIYGHMLEGKAVKVKVHLTCCVCIPDCGEFKARLAKYGKDWPKEILEEMKPTAVGKDLKLTTRMKFSMPLEGLEC